MLIIWLLAGLSHAQELLSNPRCNLQFDRGSCIQFTVKWYYDRYDHRCRRFHYGGCEGNENRFNTLEECSAACHFEQPSNRDRCFQPHDPGNCDNDIERWFFDMNKKQCVCSYWTGCGGNSNLFYSYPHCMFYCGAYAESGPGIDENYWGKRNRSTMSHASLAVFAQTGSTHVHSAQQSISDRSSTYLNQQQAQLVHQDQPSIHLDRAPSYHDRTTTYPDRPQYQDRSQSFQSFSQAPEERIHLRTIGQQTYDADQRYRQEQMQQIAADNYEEALRQASQDQHAAYRQSSQIGENVATMRTGSHYGDHRRDYQRNSHEQSWGREGGDQKARYQQTATTAAQNGRTIQEMRSDQTYGLSREQVRSNSHEQTLRRVDGDHKTHYRESTSPNGRTVVVTRTGPGYRDQHVEQRHWEHRVQPSSKISEFRSSSSHSFSAHSHFRQSASNHGFYQGAGQWHNTMPSRARGERIYRYDTGPITRTHPNGTTTINRQSIFIAESGQPTMNFVQRLPGLIKLTHVTPPSSVLTMIPPEVRRKLKKIKKMKTPPRVINPNLSQQTINLWNQSSTSSQFRSETAHRQGTRHLSKQRNETGNYRRMHNSSRSHLNDQMPQRRIEQHRRQKFAPTHLNDQMPQRRIEHQRRQKSAPTSQSQTFVSSDNQHQQYDVFRKKTAKQPETYVVSTEFGSNRSGLTTVAPASQIKLRQMSENDQAQMTTVVPHMTTTEPPPTPKLVEVQNMILNAEVSFETTTPHPTARVEAERIELTRPIVASVQARKVDFDEVLAMDAQYYDDYEEPADEPLESEEVAAEHPTEASPLPPLPRAAIRGAIETTETTTMLPPIVLPPPISKGFNRDDKKSNILSGAMSMPIALIPPAAVMPSVSEKSHSEAEKQVNVIPPVTAVEKTHTTPQTFGKASTDSSVDDQITTPQAVVGEDYPENVEFEIQTVGDEA